MTKPTDLVPTSSNRGWLRRFYNKSMEMAHTPQAFWAYCSVAFCESSFFPFPPDLLMIPMILKDRTCAWRLAFWGTMASVLGGVLGYYIGYALYEHVGQSIIQAYGLENSFLKFQKSFDEWGFWIIALKGLTPIPYKIVTISSGVARFPFETFIIASVICRSSRFYILAALFYYAGPYARICIERYLSAFFWGGILILGSGFFIFKYLG